MSIIRTYVAIYIAPIADFLSVSYQSIRPGITKTIICGCVVEQKHFIIEDSVQFYIT